MKFFSLVFAMVLLLIIGCSKDDDKQNNPAGPTVPEGAPTFKIHKIELPEKMQQSTDPHAQNVVIYTGLANNYGAAMNGYFTPPGLAKNMNDGPWEYQWQDGGLDVNVLIKKLTDKYTWEVVYNGNDGKYDYSSFVAFRAQQAENERSGSFNAYVPNTTIVLGQYSWELASDDVLHFEVSASMFMEGSRFVGSVNPDNSGTLEIYQGIGILNSLAERYLWDKDGAGEWWEFSAGNNIEDHGTWN